MEILYIGILCILFFIFFCTNIELSLFFSILFYGLTTKTGSNNANLKKGNHLYFSLFQIVDHFKGI